MVSHILSRVRVGVVSLVAPTAEPANIAYFVTEYGYLRALMALNYRSGSCLVDADISGGAERNPCLEAMCDMVPILNISCDWAKGTTDQYDMRPATVVRGTSRSWSLALTRWYSLS